MPRQPSQAEVMAIRLNPINPREKEALKRIKQLKKEGFNVKQVVVDAILRSSGFTPEMFDTVDNMTPGQAIGAFQDMLDQFSAELLKKLNTGEVRITSSSKEEDAEQDDGLSAFAKNFSRGLLQRQRINAGEAEE